MVALYIKWNVDPVIVDIFGVKLQYYGLLFVGGIALCYIVLKWIFERESLSRDSLDTLTLAGIVGILIGARLGHCLFYEFDYFKDHLLEILLPIKEMADGSYKFIGYRGLASHGGTAGLIAAMCYYAIKYKASIIDTIDYIGIVAPLGAAFIRLANLMNSEINGLPTDKPWAFVFEKVDQIPRHPAQLYEAVCYFAIFGIQIYLYKKYGHKLKGGFFFGSAIALIYIARFFIEFIKEHQVDFEDGMTLDMGQWLSIPFILVGLFFAYRSYRMGAVKS